MKWNVPSLGGTSTRVQRGSSRVGFLPSQVKPPTDVPLDLTKETFDSVEDVQTFTLQPSQLAVVIASYDKTIGRLHTIDFFLKWLACLGFKMQVYVKVFLCSFPVIDGTVWCSLTSQLLKVTSNFFLLYRPWIKWIGLEYKRKWSPI